jgi:hypothetical protein
MFRATTLSMTAFNITTIYIMAVTNTTVIIMALNRMTFGKITLSIIVKSIQSVTFR